MKKRILTIMQSIASGAIIIVSWMVIAMAVVYMVLPRHAFQNESIKQSLQQLVSASLDGAPVSFGQLSLQKGDWQTPFQIRVHDLRVFPIDAMGQVGIKPIINSDMVAIDIDPVHWTRWLSLRVDGLVMTARRGQDGRYNFGMNEQGATASRGSFNPVALLSQIGQVSIPDARFVLDDGNGSNPRTTALLNIVAMRDPAFGQSLVTAAVTLPSLPDRPVLDVIATTTDASDDGEIIAYFHDFDLNQILPWIPSLSRHVTAIEGASSGEIRFIVPKRGDLLANFNVEARVTDGTMMIAGLAQKPITFRGTTITATPSRVAFKTTIQDRPVAITIDQTAKAGFYKLDIQIPTLKPEDVGSLWPENDRDSVAAKWFTQRLANGTFKDIVFTADLIATPDPDTPWDIDHSTMRFKTEGLDVVYQPDLAPVTNLYAEGLFENGTLALTMNSGRVKDLDVFEGQLNFTHLLESGRGDCRGRLRVKGSLSSVLAYLDNPIMKYKERVSVDLSKASGDVQMTIALDLPTTKDAKIEDVKVKVDAILRRANLPDVVKGVSITGGALAIKSDPTQVTILGDASLNGTPASLKWQSYFSSDNAPFVQNLTLRSTITKETIAKFGVGNWAQDVRSPSQALVSYTQPITGTSKVNLSVTGPDVSVAKADIILDEDSALSSMTLDDLVLGRTSGDITLRRNDASGYDVVFTGSALDIRPLLSDDSTQTDVTKSPANMNITITSDALITGASSQMDRANITVRTNDRGDVARFDMDAAAQQSPVTVRFLETSRGDTVSIKAQNAGSFLRAMDITDGVNGGVLDITGKPNGQYGTMTGRLLLTDFTAKNVPILGRLINAISLPGLLELFTDKGISFDTLRGDFTWSPQNGGVLSVTDGATRGASLGLTFKGQYYKKDSTLDMAGEIVPLSEISGVVNNIPVLGPLLTGGKDGGLLAATYTMKGPTDDTAIFINPLSIITPGIVRGILFEGSTPNKDNSTNPE